MNSRMNKYYEDEPTITSRYHRNEELYREINKSELENYDIKSNATVLGDNKNEIDVEKIKQILDTKYNSAPKRKSIRIEEEPEVEEVKEITKEYDINVILEKAKEKKEVNYEEERLKKLRDTQFDILKNLNINKDEELNEAEEAMDSSEKKLKNLINTIAFNEKVASKNTALDVLSDLKGDDNTETLEGLSEEIVKSTEKEFEKEEQKLNLEDTEMINSFYTTSNALKTEDFEDIDDLEEFQKSIESGNSFVKIIIAIIVIVFLIGLAILAKTLFLS